MHTAELLEEHLEGWGYVAVEIYDVRAVKDVKFKVRTKEDDTVSQLKKSICELVEVKNPKLLALYVEGKEMNDSNCVMEEMKALSSTNWPKPYFGLVWVAPK